MECEFSYSNEPSRSSESGEARLVGDGSHMDCDWDEPRVDWQGKIVYSVPTETTNVDKIEARLVLKLIWRLRYLV